MKKLLIAMLFVAPLAQAATLEVVNETGETITVIHPGHDTFNEWRKGKFLTILPKGDTTKITKKDKKNGKFYYVGKFRNVAKSLTSKKTDSAYQPVRYLRIKFASRPNKYYIDTSGWTQIEPPLAIRRVVISHRKADDEPWNDSQGHSIPKLKVDWPRRAATRYPYDLYNIVDAMSKRRIPTVREEEQPY